MSGHTQWPGDGVDHEAQLKDVMADIRELTAEHDRMKSANEHWHVRVEALKTDIEAALESRDRLKEVNAELVEALEQLIKSHEGWIHGCGPCICVAHEKARELVAKAKEPPHDKPVSQETYALTGRSSARHTG